VLFRSNKVQFRVEAPPNYAGWFAFGLGRSMAKAEIYMGHLSASGTPTLTRRLTTSRSEPPVAPQDFAIIPSETISSPTILVITFTRPKTPSSANGVDLSVGPQDIIWAVNANSRPSPSNSIQLHTSFGILARKDLFAASSAFVTNSTTSTQQPTVFTPNGASGGSGGSSDDSDTSAAELRKLYTLLHGWFMVIGWFVLAPIGIIIARFFKGILGVWWFRLHFSLLTLAFLLTGFGFALIYASIDLTPYTHLDPSNFDTIGGAHIVTGLMIVIMTGLQVISGIVINYLFTPERMTIPWHDKLHWWFGRLNMLLAWICVPLGISLYGTLFDASQKDLCLGLLLAWTLVVIGAVFILNYRLGQTHDLGGVKLDIPDSHDGHDSQESLENTP